MVTLLNLTLNLYYRESSLMPQSDIFLGDKLVVGMIADLQNEDLAQKFSLNSF
jgi:hypothetical protein